MAASKLRFRHHPWAWRIQVKVTQTGYFQPDEYKAVIDATYLYSYRPKIDKHNWLLIGGDRIRALTELMRWMGSRIRDAVTLERNRLAHDSATGIWSVMVYQKKTGDPVYCPIPPDVAEALRTIPASQKGNTNDKYFFWTGSGLPKTIVSNWQRSYGKLFRLTAIKEPGGEPKRCHPHMLRDTFAVESLLAGMRLEEVSTILGHSSVRITEKHYMPWVRARQASLNQSVMASWAEQGKVSLGKARLHRDGSRGDTIICKVAPLHDVILDRSVRISELLLDISGKLFVELGVELYRKNNSWQVFFPGVVYALELAQRRIVVKIYLDPDTRRIDRFLSCQSLDVVRHDFRVKKVA